MDTTTEPTKKQQTTPQCLRNRMDFGNHTPLLRTHRPIGLPPSSELRTVRCCSALKRPKASTPTSHVRTLPPKWSESNCPKSESSGTQEVRRANETFPDTNGGLPSGFRLPIAPNDGHPANKSRVAQNQSLGFGQCEDLKGCRTFYGFDCGSFAL